MTRPTRVRSPKTPKMMDACPECGSALASIEPPVVRLVSSMEWTYPAPHAGRKCRSCGWTSGVAA
jgi:hypothetical protein